MRRDGPTHPVAWAVAGGGGVALGVVDLVAQLTLPYPWANLANSSAVWAVLAYALARWVRAGALRCMLTAVVLLVVAVEAYRVTAVLFLHDDPSTLYVPTTLLWLVFGVVGGCVFGFGGHLSATRERWLAAAGAALPAAVLLAEALLVAGSGRRHGTATAVVEVVLAVLVAAVAGRGLRGKAAALAVAVPLAALGWVAFRLTGFGG